MNDEEIIENLDLLLAYEILKEEKDLGLIEELNHIQNTQDPENSEKVKIQKGEENE